MSNKMGEAQVISFFSKILENRIKIKFGDAKYAEGIFSGSQDRKFADYFAGVNSQCIFIEFKEKKNEINKENIKPLRQKLCLQLDEIKAKISRSCHFIAYSSSTDPMAVEIIPYIDAVCKDFGIGSPPLNVEEIIKHGKFADDFLSSKKGLEYDKFVDYIEELNKIAGGSASGIDVPFKAMIYSKDESGDLVATRFNNFSAVIDLFSLKNKKSPGLKLK